MMGGNHSCVLLNWQSKRKPLRSFTVFLLQKETEIGSALQEVAYKEKGIQSVHLSLIVRFLLVGEEFLRATARMRRMASYQTR